jgi:nitric oxide reductase FlRd-NAD(+) reductase
MSDGIVIIGSGFAARQLVKNIRKQDANVPLTLIAADSMDEYNKPDLSHVISQNSAPTISPARRRGVRRAV